MAINNAEILTQLEGLADAQETYGTRLEQTGGLPSFRELLAELKRLYRVEAAARGVGYAAREVYLIANDGEAKDMRGYVCMDALDIGLNALDAALKEPS